MADCADLPDDSAASAVPPADSEPTPAEPMAQPDTPVPDNAAATSSGAATAGGPVRPDLAPAETAARLAELFPALFAAIPNTPPRPIKLRIQADIQQRAPELFTRRVLSHFLHRHTTSTAYLRALVASAHRYDLDGAPAGEVSDEHRQAAQVELERRRAIVQARREEQRGARRPQAHDRRAPGAPDGAAPARGDAPSGAPPRRPDARGPRKGPPHRRPQRGAPERDTTATATTATTATTTIAAPVAADRPQRLPRPPMPPRARAHARVPAWTTPRTPDPVEPPVAEPAPPPVVDDPARRERAQLLRAYESSTLSRANFCALKRIDPATLDALLEQARREAPPKAKPAPAREPQRPASPARRRPR